MTITTQPAAAPCGLNQPGNRREESETPHYDYVNGDPINNFDLDGTRSCKWNHPRDCAKSVGRGVKRAASATKGVVGRNWRTWTYVAAVGTCVAASFGACAGVAAAGFVARSAMTFRTHGFTNRSSWKTVGVDFGLSYFSIALVGAPAALAGTGRLANAFLATGDAVCAFKCPTYIK